MRDLLDLATSEVQEAPDHLQKAYDWYFERRMTEVRLAFGAAGSLVIAFLAALFREGAQIEVWQLVVAAVAVASLLVLGLWRLRQLRSIHREYLAALQLYSSLVRLGPVLRLYRRISRAL